METSDQPELQPDMETETAEVQPLTTADGLGTVIDRGSHPISRRSIPENVLSSTQDPICDSIIDLIVYSTVDPVVYPILDFVVDPILRSISAASPTAPMTPSSTPSSTASLTPSSASSSKSDGM